jgi:hypothetical protein
MGNPEGGMGMRPRKLLMVVAVLACVAWPRTGAAVVLDNESRLVVVLADGTQVVLYAEDAGGSPPPASPGVRVLMRASRAAILAGGGAPAAPPRKYYYLPVNVRLSKRADGTPEFLFMKFTTERGADRGGVSGAVLHFLMEWGLTPEQTQEAEAKLKERVPGATLAGAVPLEDSGEAGGSYQIISATLSDRTLAPSIVTSGKAPLLPGGKIAAASRLSAEGAQLLAGTLEKSKSISDVSIALNFQYQTLLPAAKGVATMDWRKLSDEWSSLSAEYARRKTGRQSSCFLFICSSSDTFSYSYDEVREQYRFLEEKQVVTVKFDETYSDERVAKIRDAFFQFFLNAMTDPSKGDPGSAAPPPSDKEKEQTPDIRTGNSYHFRQENRKRMEERRSQVFRLDYRLAVKWPVQVVGNLKSWYDAVRDNPRCVSAVNLNDPFFQHRDINFILDLDAKEMFDETVNYVTANVRKTRSSGFPFEDRVTIDSKYFKEKGLNATVTYARGEDTNPDAYEYQVQWSLKGGRVFPPSPPWQKGAWEGVTLAPPIVPRTIEVEGDLEGMKASEITRITVQVRYPKFGEEAEENISISAAAGEALVAKKIFTDRDARGYVYRLVVNHKTEGRLAFPWSAKVSDNYVYAAIPKELAASPDPAVIAEAKRTGEEMARTAGDKVLDKFKDVLGGQK